jgi:tagatose 1,6-diphosphate aldolase GatY/KbaY
VCKFNVNTEVRQAYLNALRASATAPDSDLVTIMQAGIASMREIVLQKLALFGSENSAHAHGMERAGIGQ